MIVRTLLGALVPLVDATYFYLPEGEEKCFVENVPIGLFSAVYYTLMDKPTHPCNVDFRLLKTGATVYSRGVDKNSMRGTTSYHITESDAKKRGDKRSTGLLICTSCKGGQRHWWEKEAERLRWTLRIETVYDPMNMQGAGDAQAHDTFVSSEKKVNMLLDRVNSIYAENEYERRKEEDFRQISESVNAGVMHMNIFEIILIIAITIFQVYHLRNYFRAQKLI